MREERLHALAFNGKVIVAISLTETGYSEQFKRIGSFQ